MAVIFCNIHKQQGMDSCDACDAQNPKLWRCARVSVELSKELLTDLFEQTDEWGWDDIKNYLKKALQKFELSGVKVSFEEWEADAEVV
jgi:hypothetical protein